MCSLITFYMKWVIIFMFDFNIISITSTKIKNMVSTNNKVSKMQIFAFSKKMGKNY